jgi:hypothetical protein
MEQTIVCSQICIHIHFTMNNEFQDFSTVYFMNYPGEDWVLLVVTLIISISNGYIPIWINEC